MSRKQYKIKTLPTYESDLYETAKYIKDVLKNQTAAEKLIADIEKAILARAFGPLMFKPYPTKHKHKQEYYPIYIRNFIVFYVVIDNVMEIRRLINKKRNIDSIL